MKIKLNADKGRKLVALLDEETGALFLPFRDSRMNSQKTAVINSAFSATGTVTLNGSATIHELGTFGRTPIYEGDEIILKF